MPEMLHTSKTIVTEYLVSPASRQIYKLTLGLSLSTYVRHANGAIIVCEYLSAFPELYGFYKRFPSDPKCVSEVSKSLYFLTIDKP